MPSTPGNSLNISSAGIVKFDGTATFSADTVTQYNALVGGTSNAITSVAPSATAGVPLVSGGASADPSFTTAVVAGGGTGKTSFADTNSLLISGTTTTGALQDVASVATGQVLTSAGTSTAPAWSATPTVTSITFGSGTALANYAEGTWTPTLVGHSTAGTTSYTTQTGLYTRIGRLVFCTMILSCTTGGTAAGLFQFGGLPFTINNTASGVIGLVTNSNTNLPFDTGQTMYTLYPQGGGTTFYLQESGSSKASNLMSLISSTAYVFNASFWFSI
jgi:hypothetical protein